MHYKNRISERQKKKENDLYGSRKDEEKKELLLKLLEQNPDINKDNIIQIKNHI